MFLSKDYISFLDGGSKVPYLVKEGTYFPIPANIFEVLEFENKQYMKTGKGYCVGIRLNNLVRSITAQDYRYVKSQIEIQKLLSEQEQKKGDSFINKVQFIMDFC